MKSTARDQNQIRLVRRPSLHTVLMQSEDIKETVAQAAAELESVNEALQQDDDGSASVQSVSDAIAQNLNVELKVTQAADDLDRVNAQLATQVARQSSMASELADTKSSLARALDDLSEAQSREKDSRRKSLEDPLTGIPNRASFDQALEHGLVQARRHGWRLAVLFADIDEFKSINDSYGHDAGDRVLFMVANRLQSFLRGGDTVCRWGGDEFACLLLEVQRADDLGRLADQMIGLIAADCEIDGTVLSVRASIGIALYPDDGDTAESLLRNADAAMFRAKGDTKRVVSLRDM